MLQRELIGRTRAWVRLALAVIWALSVSMTAYAVDDASATNYVETVREGLAYRTSTVRSVSGTADFEYTFSPRNCERGQREAEQYAKEIEWTGEVLPLAPTHRSRLDFAADFEAGRWRCEMVDLTVSGHSLWASSNNPALNRHLPPETFRRVSVSDGAKVYEYDFGVKYGWINPYTGEVGHSADPLASVQAMLTAARPDALRKMRDPRYSVSFEGEDTVDGQRCLKIRVAPTDGSAGGSTMTLWSAPELDFTIVREETQFHRPATSPATEPKLLATWIYTATDFARIADLLWVPKTSTTVEYDYREGLREGEDAWEGTEVIRITSLELNAAVTGIPTPYPFPEGTTVMDMTTGTAAVVGEQTK